MSGNLAETIGLADLLKPLETPPVVGLDLRSDFAPQSLYYRLRDARAEARAAERIADGDQSGEVTVPLEWRTVRQLSCTALVEKTKDLEISAWLTEALVRGDGLAGLAVGATLMSGLVSAFWDEGLFPLADEDGDITRVAPVTGLNGEGGDGTLIQPLRKLTFFSRPSGAPVAFWQYDASVKLDGEADANKKKQRIAAGVQPFADMERDAKAAGAAWYAGLRVRLRTALEAWTQMGEVLDAKAGRDAPPTGRVRTILQDMLEACQRYAPVEVAAVEEVAEQTQESGDTAMSATTGPATPRMETREDMLRHLVRIADFFRRTEPHSPLAYTLDDAVRRGRLTWPDLLAEIVPDENARRNMLIQLGIKPEAK